MQYERNDNSWKILKRNRSKQKNNTFQNPYIIPLCTSWAFIWVSSIPKFQIEHQNLCPIHVVVRIIYAEGLEFQKLIRSLEQSNSNSERSEQFLATECSFNLFLEISHIIWIRTIRIQIGKNYWDLETCRKS